MLLKWGGGGGGFVNHRDYTKRGLGGFKAGFRMFTNS